MTSGSKHYWTSGNAVSWVGGVLLGGLIGTVLLIAIPRTMGGGTAQAPAAAASAPAASEGSASAGAGASGEVAPGTTPAASEASTAAEGAPAVQTEASGSAGTPTASAEGDAEAGKAKYAATCAACHGPNAEGAIGPKLNATKDWTAEQFTAAVREGKAPEKTLAAMMPHFTADQVNDAELSNIHAFLKTVN